MSDPNFYASPQVQRAPVLEKPRPGRVDASVSIHEQPSGSEAEGFIQAVNRIAFAENRSQDSQWKAELASTAFSGNALQWFRSLSPQVQSDWGALQKALLQRYAPEEEGSLNDYPNKDSDSITLNPESEATFERSRAVFVVSQTPGPMEGYIKVISDIRNSYISRELNKAGILGTTSLLTQALRVRLTQDYNPHNIETLVRNFHKK
ncbi:hypothetical protein FRC01_003075 [Tulasnella sp. 417]|nr:hypothetical protein FRC01_003075 [Tulasnella sp. 417]